LRAAPRPAAEYRAGAGIDGSCAYRPVAESDAPELVTLAGQCFDALSSMRASELCAQPHDADAPSVARWWNWRYLARPGRNHSQVAIERATGRIAAHVGGLALSTWTPAGPRTTTLSVENMVAPARRAGLARVGVFARTVNAWVDTWFGRERDFVAWGFPSNENFRIGQRFCKYSLLRPVSILWRSVRRDDGGSACLDVRVRDEAPRDADALWREVRTELGYAVERTAEHLRWRYELQPSRRHVFLVARDPTNARLRGIAVLRAGGFDATAALVSDWIVGRRDEPVARELLAAAEEWASAHGLGTLVTWFPESSTWFERFQELGFRVRYTPILSVARSWDGAIPIEVLRREFHMTPGDIDWV
jgi:GNAT superfamily N-acetyltransferase